MEKKDYRTERVFVRVSKEEKEVLKIRAKEYGGLSQMVRTAIDYLGDISAQKKWETLCDVSARLKSLEAELGRMGNNLNQIAHQTNAAMLRGNLSEELVVNQILPTIRNIHKLFADVIKKGEKEVKKMI